MKMREMTKEREWRVHNEHNAELPNISYARTRSVNDFEVERVQFSCAAKTIREAKEAVLFLLKEMRDP